MRFDQHKPGSLFEAYSNLKNNNFQHLNEAKGTIPSNAMLSNAQRWKDVSELGKPGRYPLLNRSRGMQRNAADEYYAELRVMVRKELFPDEHAKRFRNAKKEAQVDLEAQARMPGMFLGYKGTAEDHEVQWDWDPKRKMFVKNPESEVAVDAENKAYDHSMKAKADAIKSGKMKVMRSHFEQMLKKAEKLFPMVDDNDGIAMAAAEIWADERTQEEYPEWTAINREPRKRYNWKLETMSKDLPDQYKDHYVMKGGKLVGKKWKV